MTESFDLSGLLDEFRDEARGQLDRLDGALLRLEREGPLDEEERAALLRGLHTLKGNAGMLGYLPVRDYVHAVESIFKAPPEQWSEAMLDELFEGAATLRQAIEKIGTEEEAAAFSRVAGLRGPGLVAGEAGGADTGTSLGPRFRGREARGGEEGADEEIDTSGAESATAGARSYAADESTNTIRVPFAKLDALVNRVGELFGLHENLMQFVQQNRAALESMGLRRPLLQRLELLDQLSDSLRDTAMDLRLVPIRRVFSRFPGLVRELAREQGKRARIELEGEDTELDKSTVDALAAPLLHLVRNAVDHGILSPEEREKAGKPAEGLIVLRAAQVGDRVRIEVDDDGPGLDREAIVRRAHEAGLLSTSDDLSDDEITELILRPGFSTRSEADTVSGRGIGLNVVARSVARLRGTLEVGPGDHGVGTRFILHLPLTLAVLPALVFESDGAVLALAAADVEETIRPIAQPRVAGADVVEYLDELVPIARPARLFGWSAADGDGDGAAEPSTLPPFAVIVRRGTRSAAVAADRLLDQRDVVVKALPRYLAQPRGISGASIAPDGKVVLVLDAGGIIDLNLDAHRRRTRGD